MRMNFLSNLSLMIVFGFVPNLSFSINGADLLIDKDDDNNGETSIIKQRRKLILDDSFLVQVYGNMRSIGIKDQLSLKFYDDLLYKNYISALKKSFKVKTTNADELNLLSASKLYLLWKLNLSQSFFNEWVLECNRYNFLNTEMGVALDQVISKNTSQWLLDNAIYITPKQDLLIDKISNHVSKFNFSVQAYNNLRTGSLSLKLIGNLEINDPLRYELAQSAILDYANKGQLGKAAKLVKETLEPVIETSSNTEKISSYYLLLARLLYQAKAYSASKRYYMSIPEASKSFLQARTEALWISLRSNDSTMILGELKSLELENFENKFLPEVYLVNAMANLKQCQFSEVQRAFNQFVRVNKKFALILEKNLLSEKYTIPPHTQNPYIIRLLASRKNITQESILFKGHGLENIFDLTNMHSQISKSITVEQKRFIQGQKKILESTLKRMRFVKVEFLSTMRRLKSRLAQSVSKDRVSTLSSAIDTTDKLEFKFDNIMFSDELFSIYSEVKNLCLQGKPNDK